MFCWLYDRGNDDDYWPPSRHPSYHRHHQSPPDPHPIPLRPDSQEEAAGHKQETMNQLKNKKEMAGVIYSNRWEGGSPAWQRGIARWYW